MTPASPCRAAPRRQSSQVHAGPTLSLKVLNPARIAQGCIQCRNGPAPTRRAKSLAAESPSLLSSLLPSLQADVQPSAFKTRGLAHHRRLGSGFLGCCLSLLNSG